MCLWEGITKTFYFMIYYDTKGKYLTYGSLYMIFGLYK